MRSEYRRQDFPALERGKFYPASKATRAASDGGSNQNLKAVEVNLQSLIALALQLDPADRADLAAVLQASLPPTDPEIERLWQEEAIRRLDAHRRGESVGIPAEEVFGKGKATNQ